MENGPDALQSNPNPGATAFGQLRAECKQESFDIRPRDIGTSWFGKDGIKSIEMLLLHFLIVSQYDTIDKGFISCVVRTLMPFLSVDRACR